MYKTLLLLKKNGGRYVAKGGMKLDDSKQLFGVLDVTNGSVKNLLTLLDRLMNILMAS